MIRSNMRKGLLLLSAALLSYSSLSSAVSDHGPKVVDEAKSDSYKDITFDLDPAVAAKGEAVYKGLCINCHENSGLNRAPQRFTLMFMTPEAILKATTDGIMKENTKHLSLEEKEAVAQYITMRKLGAGANSKPTLMCDADQRQAKLDAKPALQGWGFDRHNTHFIDGDTAGIDRSNVGSLKLKWALNFPTAVRARSQPLVVGNTMYVGSQPGTVYALDLETGCTRWIFQASAEVKVGMLIGDFDPADKNADPYLYFGDLIGNEYAIKARNGELVWRKRVDDHPATTLSGTAALVGDTLFVPASSLEEGSAGSPEYPCCTFRGSLVALDAKSGEEKFRTYMVPEPKITGKNAKGANKFGPAGVPIWTSPVVDEARGLIYVATGDNYSTPATNMSDSVVAINITDGKIRWHYQAREDDAWNGSCEEKVQYNCPDEDGPDHDYGSSPVIAKGKDGKDYLIAADKGGVVVALNPDNGKVAWTKRVSRGGVVGGILFGLAAHDGVVYIPVTDVPDGRTYDIDARPGVYAVDIASGEYVWQAPAVDDVCNGRAACYPGAQTVPSVTPDLVFVGSNDGYLRAYDRLTGKVLWETDTAIEFDTVSGDRARGGSIGGSGSAIAINGMLITNSGYGFAGKMPGGVLAVYSVE